MVDMMGRLHVELFLQDKFLLNGVDVKIRLVDSKDAFSLCQNPNYKVRIGEATLFARKAVLSTTVQMAHIKALAKGTAKYPLRPVDCKVYSIPQGAMSHTHENLFLGTLPKRLILWCIDNDAYNGNYAKKNIQRQVQRQKLPGRLRRRTSSAGQTTAAKLREWELHSKLRQPVLRHR